jgi:hypothetical protein
MLCSSTGRCATSEFFHFCQYACHHVLVERKQHHRNFHNNFLEKGKWTEASTLLYHCSNLFTVKLLLILLLPSIRQTLHSHLSPAVGHALPLNKTKMWWHCYKTIINYCTFKMLSMRWGPELISHLTFKWLQWNILRYDIWTDVTTHFWLFKKC